MKRIQLGDLQHEILQVLWRLGQATVQEVHQALHDDRGLAPTTIATLLKRLESKGLVSHAVDGRRFVYAARVSEAEVRKSLITELAERLFDGNAAAFATHLVAEHEIDRAELAELKQHIEQATRRRSRKSGAGAKP